MDRRAFRSTRSGKVLRTARDYDAFVPHALPPPALDLGRLTRPLEEASLALGELRGIGSMLPNPYLLIRPFVRREAVLSSRIEGTLASLSDLFVFEAQETGGNTPADVQEVHNYVRALEYGLTRLETLPVSLRLIRELHEMLLNGVRGEHGTPGQFRTSQNWIGHSNCKLNNATFVPPPPEEMMKALSDWELFHHQQNNLPLLIRLGLSHYQFEAVHPFIDGNGRVGRLLLPLLLCEQRALPQPLLYLSAFFEAERDEYYRLLLAVSQKGEWEEWLEFFLAAVTAQSFDAVKRIGRLQELQQRYRTQFQTARSSALLLRLIDRLCATPVIRISQARDELKITFRAAQANIEKLVEAGLLTEVTGQERNRIFVAREILGAFSDS